MTNQDRVFFRTFLVVLAVLISIAFAIYFVASGMANSDDAATGIDDREAASITERIAPVGKVAVGEPPAENTGAAAASREPRSGAELVTGVCAACHGAGVLGAPKIGDASQWNMASGLDALVNLAINGQGAMPPRGGDPSATDDEIRAAVIEMLKQSGLSP